MSKTLFTLPPLSPDYSGISSVLHDLGALTVLHDASGCTGTYTGYDEPRWFGSKSPVFCSGMREMDAILGADEKLLQKMEDAQKESRPPFAAVVGSPVPTLIGFDFQGFAAMAQKHLGIPVLGFPAAGINYYDLGQRDAYLVLAERFLNPAPVKNDQKVNLLGASALDGFDDDALRELFRFLNGAGLLPGAVWGTHSGLDEIAESGGAGANWALTAAALPLARYLRERFGTPFIAGLPIGEKNSRKILSFLKNQEHPAGTSARETSSAETLLIGEALFCDSLRGFLEEKTGTVKIGTFFICGKELLREGDLLFSSEDDAEKAMGRVKTVYADPLFEGLLPFGPSKPRFIPIPHCAVSGRLYDESRRRFFTESFAVC
jgi:nitrogenase molybdenum-iron protein alpha/beta subunit